MAEPMSDPVFETAFDPTASDPLASAPATFDATTDTYVPQQAWLRPVGRPDLIDEVADQFERPTAPGSQTFWAAEPDVRWPRASRGWRSQPLIHRAGERRAG